MSDEEDEDQAVHTVYRDGRVHVLKSQCETCIFNPKGRFVSGRRVADMVEQTKDVESATVVCHSTLYNQDGKHDTEHAICRGWWDRFAHFDVTLRLAQVMEVVTYQAIPPKFPLKSEIESAE